MLACLFWIASIKTCFAGSMQEIERQECKKSAFAASFWPNKFSAGCQLWISCTVICSSTGHKLDLLGYLFMMSKMCYLIMTEMSLQMLNASAAGAGTKFEVFSLD
jgi:hypothetical protein